MRNSTDTPSTLRGPGREAGTAGAADSGDGSGTVPSSDVKVRRSADRGLSRRVRVRPSAFDPGVIHLALADQGIVPDPDELAGWVDTLAAPRRRARDPHRRAVRRGR